MHIKATHCFQQLYRSLASVLRLCLAAERWSALGQYCNNVMTLDSQVVHLCWRTIPMVILGRWLTAAVARVLWQRETHPIGCNAGLDDVEFVSLQAKNCVVFDWGLGIRVKGHSDNHFAIWMSVRDWAFCCHMSLVRLWINNEPGFYRLRWSLLGQVDHWIF